MKTCLQLDAREFDIFVDSDCKWGPRGRGSGRDRLNERKSQIKQTSEPDMGFSLSDMALNEHLSEIGLLILLRLRPLQLSLAQQLLLNARFTWVH